MTLYELALEYRQTASQLRERIKELEQEYKSTEDDRKKSLLDGRIRKLRPMYRDTQAVAMDLENYYRKFAPRRDAPTKLSGQYAADHRRRP